ncbi:IMPACT family protein [Microbacterium azadirachtae]|uniref:IMPACT family member YigZ n=1 Tax=Microbacterium azadirachtae TaxID=582680 RepID=A0A0F0LRI3_9MICO|nr:YigZ family protein [Microbacterium azadirachtae]KJL34151.1 IMPACT family member YigZ [Microbacterium azadirachtae]
MTRSYPDTIAAPVTRELVVKKSRFIAHLVPVRSVAEADEVIGSIRRQYWDARHNCTAMVTGVTGDQARSSDDGEPSGTAGIPMLEVLRRRGLTDVVAVVTRYFGGVKLGAGGLIRAYSTAVSDALDESVLLHRRELLEARVDVPHADAGRIDNGLRDWAGTHGSSFGEVVYGSSASFTLWIPLSDRTVLIDDLAALSAGALSPVFGGTRVVEVAAD